MDNPLAIFPIWVVVIDYLLGVVMWTLVGRTAMSFFLPAGFELLLHAGFRAGDRSPAQAVFAGDAKLPAGALVPLYVAWFFFMIRFYIMPWLLGYSVMGMLSFPLESEFAHAIYYYLK